MTTGRAFAILNARVFRIGASAFLLSLAFVDVLASRWVFSKVVGRPSASVVLLAVPHTLSQSTAGSGLLVLILAGATVALVARPVGNSMEATIFLFLISTLTVHLFLLDRFVFHGF